MQLIKVENNQILLNEDVSNHLKELYKVKAEYDVLLDRVKGAIKKAMEENMIKSFENDFLKITYVAPHEKISVDTERLKSEGLYDQYSRTSEVESSIKVMFK